MIRKLFRKLISFFRRTPPAPKVPEKVPAAMTAPVASPVASPVAPPVDPIERTFLEAARIHALRARCSPSSVAVPAAPRKANGPAGTYRGRNNGSYRQHADDSGYSILGWWDSGNDSGGDGGTDD